MNMRCVILLISSASTLTDVKIYMIHENRYEIQSKHKNEYSTKLNAEKATNKTRAPLRNVVSKPKRFCLMRLVSLVVSSIFYSFAIESR